MKANIIIPELSKTIKIKNMAVVLQTDTFFSLKYLIDENVEYNEEQKRNIKEDLWIIKGIKIEDISMENGIKEYTMHLISWDEYKKTNRLNLHK